MDDIGLAATEDSRREPLDLSHHFSRSTRKRVANALKKYYHYFRIPGMGNLAGGLPNARYFPYDTLEANSAFPDRFKPTPNDPVDSPTDALGKLSMSEKPIAGRLVVPHDSSDTNLLSKIDLASALQYGQAQGYPSLYTWLRQFTNEVYHPNIPYKGGAEIILDCGTTDGLAKAYEIFFNPWDKDRDWIREREGLLVEEFAYSNAMEMTKPRDINLVPVAIDDEGMLPYGKGGLLDVMENWDFSRGKRPHAMYTVTMGHNPTGGVLSLARREQLYKICSEYDILIFEDDPYWYLQYPSANTMSIKYRGRPVSQNYPAQGHSYNNPVHGKKSSGFEFLDSLVPSYLSVDTDGRVLRFDTFSKTVAPGCRMGWITGQPAIIERFLRLAESSTQQPSGFTQSLIAELLVGPSSPSSGGKGGSKDGMGWKAAGWVRWLEGLRGNYERRMNIMCSILEEHKYVVNITSSSPSSPSASTKRLQDSNAEALTPDSEAEEEPFTFVSKMQIYDFTWPMGGMFLWLRINIELHPLSSRVDSQRLMLAFLLYLAGPDYLVLSTPGSPFCASEQIQREKGHKYMRLCFAAIDEELLKGKTIDFANGVKNFFAIKTVKEIDGILKDEDNDNTGKISPKSKANDNDDNTDNDNDDNNAGRTAPASAFAERQETNTDMDMEMNLDLETRMAYAMSQHYFC